MHHFTKLLICCFLLCALVTGEADAQAQSNDNIQSSIGSSVSSRTISNFTVPAGNDRLLLVYAANNSSASITSITFNAQNLMRIISSDALSTSTFHLEIWYLKLGAGAAVSSNIVGT